MSDQNEPAWTNRLNSCKHHGDDHEACAVYGGRVPCDAEGGEAVGVVTFDGTVAWFPSAIVHAGTEVYSAPQPDKWIPKGWKLAPEKPSLSMCEAGRCVPRREFQSEGDWVSEIYLAMLDARPAPPEQESE